ncbi:GDSL-type esterase/lipase family protein [Terriglobus saanensis]|uniref:Lipolytic protein G-D-S-L family n=1 Tax=Terriglobus saanensis (strain ATCC BAA-1853 / DSM 23119 / SP1PR4) TaxID=401053 RepID=E8V3G3_TERSS|nr:GDSL-type esterase/lipase family protein [Terriglobus saanensis]ADV83576.1 lipolytic protein G-D-S-L family [Terriglobus saanensis SP1PR4]
MKLSALLFTFFLASAGISQTTPATVSSAAPLTHTNIHPPLEDWARLGVYEAENKRLAALPITLPRVVFLGDSITNHWQDAKYSSLFQDKPNYIDRGINGGNAGQMLLRYRSDVLALKPKVVVLLAGTNDLVAFKVSDTVAFIEQTISSIVDLAEANHERIILCSVLPVSDALRPQTTDRHPEDILRLNAWLKSHAAERHVQYVDYYAAMTDGHDRLQTSLTIDGLHPNHAGYEKMEPLVNQAIERELAHR